MPKQSKKDSILKTAKLLFSEKGNDATGMEEIASMTSVPKSLIYYHFKNKEALLNTIIAQFLGEYEGILQDSSERGIDKITRYTRFIESNKDCARILLTESLKQSGNQSAIFKAVETLGNNDPETADHAHLVTEFFTSILPSILFVCYKENWCQHFDVQPETLENDFMNAYKWTHGAYHERIKKKACNRGIQ